MQGRTIQMSTWVIGGKFGGMAFRESKDHKFRDGSPFLPHVIIDAIAGKDPEVQEVEFSSNAYNLYKTIYGDPATYDSTKFKGKISSSLKTNNDLKSEGFYKKCIESINTDK